MNKIIPFRIAGAICTLSLLCWFSGTLEVRPARAADLIGRNSPSSESQIFSIVHLKTPGQKYLLESRIGGLNIEAQDVEVEGRGGMILGDLNILGATRAQVNGVQVGGQILIKDSSLAKVANSNANELLVEGGENVTVAANQITGGCHFTSSNGVTITGQVCSSMFLAGTASAPFTSSTIRYNIIRNTITDLSGQPDGNLRVGRMSELLGASNAGDAVPPPCPNTSHVIEYNYFEGNHNGGAYDDEPFIFRFRCAKGTALAQNKIRFNTFVATGNQLGVYFRDHVDYLLFEGNSVIVNNPNFHSALLIASGNDGPYSDDPSDNLFLRNLISSQNPVSASIYLQGAAGNNVFRENVVRSSTMPAIRANVRAAGNIFEHNSFISGAATAVLMDYSPAGATHLFSYNIIANNSASGASTFQFDHGAAVDYQGDHNLFYNSAGSAPVPSQDTSARVGNPAFVSPASPAFDFRIGASSAARQGTGDTSDRGALQFSQTCSGTWFCSTWSACLNNVEIRICPGLNDCGQPNPQPYQTRACGSGDQIPPTAPTNLQVHQ